jgi:3-oxoacyl-[acyl-carrier-protein] synthase III
MIGFFLARHGFRPDDIDEVVGHPGVPSLSGAVCRFLGRPEAVVQHQVCVHLGAAQSLVQLARVPGSADRHRKRRVLFWGFGTGGFVGAALFEIRGAPILCQQDDVHLVS